MKILHTMLRVGDLDRSIRFYRDLLGMRLLRTADRPEQKYTLAFLAYGDGNHDGSTEIELTYNYGVTSYDLGSAYGHIALGVENIQSMCDAVRSGGGKITREPGLVKGGNSLIAFIEDPDGYKIELIQTSNNA